MAQRIIRPLDCAGLFDEIFDLYKNNYLVLLGITSVIYVPLYLLQAVVPERIGTWLFLPITILMQEVVTAAVTWAVSRSHLAEPITISGAYKSILSRLLLFIRTLLIPAIVVTIGLFLCLAPGILMMIRYTFIPQVFMLEGKSGPEARRRSAALGDGNGGRIFGIMLMAWLLCVSINLALTFPYQMKIWHGIAVHVPYKGGLPYWLLTGIAACITTPIYVIAKVLLYYDLRVRKEGFDIEMLAQSMHSNDIQKQTALS